MEKIDKNSSSNSSVTFGECNVWRLLFADDLALLSSNKSDLQYTLDQFSDACLDAKIKISMAETEIMCLFYFEGLCITLKEFDFCIFQYFLIKFL